MAGGLLYVEPVYIERTGQASSYPQLAKVLVYYGNRIGYAPTLKQALDQVFGAGAGNGTAGATQAPPAAGTAAPPASGGAAAAPQVAAAAAAIQSALAQLKAAQASGDFAAQGNALAALDAAVKQFQTAQAAAGGG